MADPIAMSRDELVDERPLTSTANGDKPQEMDVDLPAGKPRTKLQIAAILVALNVCHYALVFPKTDVLIFESSLYSSQPWIKQLYQQRYRRLRLNSNLPVVTHGLAQHIY